MNNYQHSIIDQLVIRLTPIKYINKSFINFILHFFINPKYENIKDHYQEYNLKQESLRQRL